MPISDHLRAVRAKVAHAVVREVWEEAGILVEPVALAGVFAGPGAASATPTATRWATS